MISERQKLILLAVVGEYIKTAQPVGSRLIFEKYDFDISPATFRKEFSDLEDMGFLHQPHTSAGRVPTDKGYRFFVNHILEKRSKERKQVINILEDFSEMKRKHDEIFAEMAKKLSQLTNSVVLSGSVNSKMFFKTGIHEMLSQPELEDGDLRNNFGNIIDSFEDELINYTKLLSNDQTLILIGKENPAVKAKNFSVIVSKCKLGSDGEGLLVLLGPKRMDYERNLNVINSLVKLLK